MSIWLKRQTTGSCGGSLQGTCSGSISVRCKAGFTGFTVPVLIKLWICAETGSPALLEFRRTMANVSLLWKNVTDVEANLIFFSPCCFSLFLFWNCLHWFPVSFVLIITYKALHNLGLAYFSDALQPYAPAHSLRSSSVGLLVTPKFRRVNMGTRSFSVVAPRLWNALTQDIHQASSIISFKNLLKKKTILRKWLSNCR